VSPPPILGWDIGGAHLKAALLGADDILLGLWQRPCPLWRGLEKLEQAMDAVLTAAGPGIARHAVTMTGELADIFAGRDEGVSRIIDTLRARLPAGSIRLFAGARGLLAPEDCGMEQRALIASANWLASARYAAGRVPQGVFVDVGSTTTDLVPFRDGAARYQGYTDHERLRCGELVYTGVARTPLMAVADRVPFDGAMIPFMAELFATTADVYRLTGELPEHADPWPAADGGEKTRAGSARRLARMIGLDFPDPADLPRWQRLAGDLRERQLARLGEAAARLIVREKLDENAPLAGAGVGRFLARHLAERLHRPYVDMNSLFPGVATAGELSPADIAPAVAVALLARKTGEA
jgi:probable H4MPT-linked C1 transfer pathway protein